jgi:type III pantothenate kinase
MTSPTLIAINVGNTRTHFGLFRDGQLMSSHRLVNSDLPQIIATISSGWKEMDDDDGLIVIGSVNDAVADPLRSTLADQLGITIYRVGDDIPVPIGESLDPETITGVDRLLNAAAAFDTLKQACIIVDAGTAVTVDFVDGAGVFHGGAIAPGARLQLAALHEHTAALPSIEFRPPDGDAFGRNTAQAMLHGVFHGIRGLVWRLVEQYAEAYGAFPLVVATGGDAATLFENDELINRIVPDLTLLGIEVAARYAITDGAASRDDDDGDEA